MDKSDDLLCMAKEASLGNKLICADDKIITTFGSARMKPSAPCYKYAYELSYKLGLAGFSIMTGGGPGIMEASSKGGFDAGVSTYGINIELPHEQAMNPYVNRPFVCNSLVARKRILINNSVGFIIFQGGFGTLDELFEVLTLVTTGKIKIVPIVLVGSVFWDGLKDWIDKVLLDNGYVTAKEVDFMKILDNQDEIINIFKNL